MRAQQLTHIGHRHIRHSAAHIAAGQRDLEVQFPQPIPQTDLPQRQATRQRTQRRVVHRHQRRGQLGGGDIDRPPRQVPSHLRPRARRRSPPPSGRRSPAPRAPATRTSHRAATPPSATARPDRTACSVNGISPVSSSSSMTSGSLVTPAASATRIRPEYEVRRHAGVDSAVEVPHCQVRRHRLGRHRRRRGDHRLLDRPARPRPPTRGTGPSRRRRRSSRAHTGRGTHGVAGSAAAQQPGQAAVGLVAGR